MITMDYLITALIVVLIPGTGVLYTLSMGLFVGRKASLFAALGCTFGIVPSLLASVLGLAVILHTSALAFLVVKYAGVLYLLYLAYGLWKNSSGLSVEQQGSNTQSMRTVALRGFLINILNPKLTLFFLAFLPQFLPVDAASTTQAMLLLGAVFMLITFVLYGLLAHRVREYVIHSQTLATYLQRTFAAGFALLGVKLALTER